MAPGLQVPSAKVAGVYLTPLRGCAGCGQAWVPPAPTGTWNSPRRPCSDTGLASWGIGWENTPLSLSVCTSSLPVSLISQKPRGNPTGLGDPGRGGVAHFLGLWERWLCSAFIFPILCLLHFILPWHLPLATPGNVLPHSAWDQPKKAATFLGRGLLSQLLSSNPPLLSLSFLVHKFPECGLNSRPFSGYTREFEASLVAQRVKNLPAMQETWVWSLGWEDPLEKGMATHSNILALRIPMDREPDGLWSMRSQRAGHDWAINTHTQKSFRW